MQKFVPRSRSKIFHNECARSTPLDPKLMCRCVSYNFGALGTVWLSYESRCKTGRTGAKVCAKKSLQNFSQRTHPIHPIGPYHVSVRFVQFWCIGDRLVELQNSVQNGRNGAKVVPRSRVGIFRNERTRSTPFDPKKCFGAFHKILVHLGPFS